VNHKESYVCWGKVYLLGMRIWVRDKGRFLFIGTLVFFLAFTANLFSAVSTDRFLLDTKDSQALVANQIGCRGEIYSNQLLGYHNEDGYKESASDCSQSSLAPYSSQFGLQGKVYTFGYKVISSVVPHPPSTYVVFAELMTALVSAVVFSLLALWVKSRYGLLVSAVFIFLVAISPMVVVFARNLYWALPLMLLPLIFTLYQYRPDASMRYKGFFWLVLLMLLYLRYLNGYEYLTTFTIMVVAGVAYHLYLSKSRVKTYVLEAVMIGLISVTAFLGALSTHVYALKDSTGSLESAIHVVQQRATSRVVDSDAVLSYPYMNFRQSLPDVYKISAEYLPIKDKEESGSEIWATLIAALNYALLPIINIPLSLYQPFSTYTQSFIVFVVAVGTLFYTRKKWSTKRLVPDIEALALSSAIGLVGYVSWLVIARPHALVHAHINGILMYLPFALFGYVIIGLWIQSLSKRLKGLRK